MKITDTLEKRIQDLLGFNPDLKRSDFDYKININKIHQFEFCFEMTQDAKDLLKKAVQVLEFSVNDLERIEKIALAVIKADKLEICKAIHIAEAIQYVNPKTRVN